MPLFAFTNHQLAGGQVLLAAFLAISGFVLLLPRPRQQFAWAGVAALVAALAVFAVWASVTFGNPMPNSVGTALFWLFSIAALGFGSVLVVQRNPGRGAIAFAFVILSTCGLFLLLAAPFLMAATIVIYAGAIIVTFLFVLMLSQPRGSSNENDRSREPLFGALAGFAFVGLVLFALYLTALGKGEVEGEAVGVQASDKRLPKPEVTGHEREVLVEVIAKLDAADEHLAGDLRKDVDRRLDYFATTKELLSQVVGVSREDPKDQNIPIDTIRYRLEKEPGRVGEGAVLYREDQQTRGVLLRTEEIRRLNWLTYHNLELLLIDKKGDLPTVKADIQRLRDEIVLLRSSGELPARNVANLGYVLYADHLLAIELAGTLLLIAAIGAVAIAHRRLPPVESEQGKGVSA